MAKYRLVFKASVAKDLRKIPNPDVARILLSVEGLQDNPRPQGCEKLSGLERYRIRRGAYRIIYEIMDTTLVVTIVKVGHRKQVYQRG